MVRTAIKVDIIQGRLTGGSHLENAAHLSYANIKCTKKKFLSLIQTIYALLAELIKLRCEIIFLEF